MLHSTHQHVWWHQMRTKTIDHQRRGQCDKVASINIKACDKHGVGGMSGTQGRCTLAECRAFCEVHSEFNCSYYSFEAAEGECYLFDGCKNLNTLKSMTYVSYHLDQGGADQDGAEHDVLDTGTVHIGQLPQCHGRKDNEASTEFGIGPEILSNLARLYTLLFSQSL